MKYIVMALAATTAIAATPAMAGTLNAEVRFADPREDARDSTEYRVQWDAPLVNQFTYGIELQVRQKEDAGNLTSKLTGKVGYNLPEVLGFKTQAYGEIGKSLSNGNNFEYWGAGIKTKRDVYGPVSVNVGYRHRQGFNGVDGMNEERVNAGLGYAITKNDVVSVTYYRTSGTTRQDQIGVGLTHAF